MSTPRVYRLIDNEVEIGEFTQTEIMKRIGVSRYNLLHFEETGGLYLERYRFVNVGMDPAESTRKEKLQALIGWDEARFKLNPKAKGWERHAKER